MNPTISTKRSRLTLSSNTILRCRRILGRFSLRVRQELDRRMAAQAHGAHDPEIQKQLLHISR
jgi:hypothetical protein